MNLFMMPPVMAMHGMMEVRARARRQLRMYARMKPVKKAPRKLTTKATFSEVPICTKSVCTHQQRSTGRDNSFRKKLTRVRLNTSGYFTSSHRIEIRNILTQNCLEIFFPKTFGIDLAGVHPDVHVRIGRNEQTKTYTRVTSRMRILPLFTERSISPM